MTEMDHINMAERCSFIESECRRGKGMAWDDFRNYLEGYDCVQVKPKFK